MPKRDRAEYMREYRAGRKAQADVIKRIEVTARPEAVAEVEKAITYLTAHPNKRLVVVWDEEAMAPRIQAMTQAQRDAILRKLTK